jgi:hypothetical protein
VWFTTDDRARHPVERAERNRAAEPVGRKTEVALQLFQTALGVWPEDAVDAARVEAQVVESLLQRRDVVAVLHVTGTISQHSVAEPPARTFKTTPCRWPHHAVGDQAALLLEGPHGSVDGLIERGVPLVTVALSRLAGEQAEQREVVADLCDSGSAVAEAIRRGRHSTSAGSGR